MRLAGLALGGLGRVGLEAVDLTFSFSCSLTVAVLSDSRLAAIEVFNLDVGSPAAEVLRTVGVADVEREKVCGPEGVRVGVADDVQDVD